MTPDTIITGEELHRAWKNWLHWHRGIHCETVETRFYAYVHSLEQSFIDDLLVELEYPGADCKVCSDTAQRIKQIAGPHADTVIAAYFVKHPWTT